MLESIEIKFTEAPQALQVPMRGVTLFVGGNNSGKSLVLREIERGLKDSSDRQNGYILKDYIIREHSEQQVRNILNRLVSETDQAGMPSNQSAIRDKDGNEKRRSSTVAFDGVMSYKADKINRYWFVESFLSYDILRLDGRTRFGLVDDKGVGDLLGPTLNWFMTLFNDDDVRAKVRGLVKDALGRYIVVDPTLSGHLRLRLSDVQPDSDEQSLSAKARSFHNAAPLVKSFSDGVQAYIGIIGTVTAGRAGLVLLDEPEAFLHPPLAKKLGYQLASGAVDSNTTLAIATHSSDILIGCLQGCNSVNVVRLEYDGKKSRGRLIPSDLLRSFYNTPLMRSANVISALFYDGVIVTESDNDRAFYGEIYHRLSEQAPSDFPSVLFLNAQNKQTTKDIVGPLRRCGIPSVAIVDIDVLKDGGGVWTSMLSSVGFPEMSSRASAAMRAELVNAYRDAGKDMKKDGGVNALDAEKAEAANQLFDQLDEYGLFVVRNGELESWLQSLGVRSKKTDWTIEILAAMGSDATAATYAKPGSGDVWDFMRNITSWVRNTQRKGM